MRPELDKKLVEAFPNLYRDRYADMKNTAMCWGFECDDGWFDIIWRMSEKLETLILEKSDTELNFDAQSFYGCKTERELYRASQIKEKYGALICYMAHSSEAMEEIIDAAEKESEKTCESCGAPACLMHYAYWYKTVCEKCNLEDFNGDYEVAPTL